jgi:hypothetical protein
MKRLNRLTSLCAAFAMGILPACGASPENGSQEVETRSTSQALSSTFAWGFVWAQSPTGTYTADSNYSRNSSGGVSGLGINNTITQTGTGSYRIDFPNIGSEIGGNVQVTAYGSGSERCKVASWGSSGTTLQVFVNCYDASGNAVNTQFTASYVRVPYTGTVTGGYLWANQPTTSSYTPNTTYQWNSTGANNTITRTGTGAYTATFPGLTFGGGTVEVTAYGSGSGHCKVVSWGGTNVNVACFTSGGSPLDTTFTLNYANQISPNGTPSFAYAWADQASASSYTPATTYQYGFLHSECSSFMGPITVRRSSVGHYAVQIPTLAATGSNVKVTAYGSSSESCKVVSWFASGSGTEADVACFNASGVAVDTRYVIVYTTDQYIIC